MKVLRIVSHCCKHTSYVLVMISVAPDLTCLFMPEANSMENYEDMRRLTSENWKTNRATSFISVMFIEVFLCMCPAHVLGFAIS